MKSVQSLIVVIGVLFGASHSHGAEPIPPEDLLEFKKPGPPIPESEGRGYIVSPRTRENCEGWVQLRYEHWSDITNDKLEVLDSKPAGKYDGEAANALLDILTYQSTKHMSGLTTVVDENGNEMNVFTYSVNCDNVKEVAR